MAEMVRRRSFGCVLPLGRHASTNGSKFVHCASDTIALSSFQKEQNARHHKQFKGEQALELAAADTAAIVRVLNSYLVPIWPPSIQCHDRTGQQLIARHAHAIDASSSLDSSISALPSDNGFIGSNDGISIVGLP